MNSAIIIHGTCDEKEYFSDRYPSLSNSHWFPWLQKQLLIKNIIAQTPEMPDAYQPDYEKWRDEFEKYSTNENTILVGHSCGGGFLLRWLSENKIIIKKLVLIAPWLDPEKKNTDTFFDFTIDESLMERTNIHILVSSEDSEEIQQSVKTIIKKLPKSNLHNFQNMGHFTYEDMKTAEFPRLLEIIENN